MSYFKKYAKRKSKIKITNIFLLIIIVFLVFEIFQNSTWNRTEGDTKNKDNEIPPRSLISPIWMVVKFVYSAIFRINAAASIAPM